MSIAARTPRQQCRGGDAVIRASAEQPDLALAVGWCIGAVCGSVLSLTVTRTAKL